MDAFSLGSYLAIQPKHIILLGGTVFTVGLLKSALALLAVFCTPIVVRLCNEKNRQNVMAWCLLFSVFGNLLSSRTSSVLVYSVARLICVVSVPLQTVLKGIVAECFESIEESSKILRRLGHIGTVGFIIGRVVGGHLADYDRGTEYVYTSMAACNLISIGAIKQMLNLNQPVTKFNNSEPVWKILVYDRVGQDIISPLISIKELRAQGVTLFVQLHSDRDPIPEVPAVYFCAPTEENIGRISQDFQRGTYDIYHLNFISPISRQKLEDLASSAIAANCVANIHKVFDQYVNFITLEDDLFVLKHQNSDQISYYSILDGIKSRKLDTFFELEEKIMCKAQGLEKPLMEILSDPSAGAPEDKLRLFVIFYICSQQISDADLKRSFAKMASGGSSLNQYEGAGTKTVSMFSKLVSQGSNFVMEGVKNLVIKRHNLPVTKVVDNLMEFKNCPEMEEYHYLDPKQLKLTEIPRNRSPFQEAIVFVVGGGNYIEYQNLVDYAKIGMNLRGYKKFA
ncbi:unnamed protein product [Callosobruchus maculatus]|uniref:Sec1 family domain-containing protein 1 n=1 Tax=Callosobruchus maculatus TaxID=64391 RepID=A0A653BVS1_CALMS|nr:unnamed protein product [Callosobruchus maculatus]